MEVSTGARYAITTLAIRLGVTVGAGLDIVRTSPTQTIFLLAHQSDEFLLLINHGLRSMQEGLGAHVLIRKTGESDDFPFLITNHLDQLTWDTVLASKERAPAFYGPCAVTWRVVEPEGPTGPVVFEPVF